MFQPFVCMRCDGEFRNIRLYRRHRCPGRSPRVTVYDKAETRYRRKIREDRIRRMSPTPAVLGG